METIFWTMKDGKQIEVDHMTIKHLRNTLKMLIKNHNKAKTNPKFQINGEIAQSMIDDALLAYYEHQMGIDDEQNY